MSSPSTAVAHPIAVKVKIGFDESVMSVKSPETAQVLGEQDLTFKSF